jgi:transcription elongation GreA/GreB family factor
MANYNELVVSARDAEGRVSVLSPAGRALLGRRRGALSSLDVPGGRSLAIRILEIENEAAKEAA